MSKSKRWRPEVEALEAVSLLSGLGAEVHAAAVPVPAVAAKSSLANPLVLTGSVHGTFTSANKGISTLRINASGSFARIGNVRLRGTLAVGYTIFVAADGSVQTGVSYGSATISSARQGTLSVDIALPGSSKPGTYTITGGTQAFAGATGTGTVVLPNTANPRMYTLRFSA